MKAKQPLSNKYKIALAALAVVVVGGIAYTGINASQYQGRLSLKDNVRKQYTLENVHKVKSMADWYNYNGKVVSAVTSPVPSIVVSQVTTKITTNVPSVVVSPVTSPVATKLSPNDAQLKTFNNQAISNLPKFTLDTIKTEAKKYRLAHPEKFTLTKVDKQKIMKMYKQHLNISNVLSK